MSENTSQPCMALAVPFAWVQVVPAGRPFFVPLRTDAELLALYSRRYDEVAREAGRMDAAPGKIRDAAFLLGQVDALREIFASKGGVA